MSRIGRKLAICWFMFCGISCRGFSFIKTIFPRTNHIQTTRLFVASDKIITNNMLPKDDQGNSSTETQAKIVSLDSLEECGARLRQGDLVAFPTETVYGLGCNALDPEAILKVFHAKERPLTDPLITHVSQNSDAFGLWNADASSTEGKALRAICNAFWPGPLTLVSKAAPHVPPTLMANTGFVACRAPRHPISIALINEAKVPIAAPSANKFGHVSPTRAHHVWDDLKYENVWIIDTADQNSSNVCDVGVESSVAKIEMTEDSKGKITLLRQGAISAEDIQECIDHAGLADAFLVVSSTKRASKDESVPEVAPGQTIRHYSPNIPSRILSQSCYKSSSESVASSDDEKTILSTTVLLDFGGKLKSWKQYAIAYRDLSETRDSAEATKSVFEALRWAERVEGAHQILFPEIVEDEGDTEQLDALTLALKDRLTRAASGVVIDSLQ